MPKHVLISPPVIREEAPRWFKEDQDGTVERRRNSRDDGWQWRWVGPWVDEPVQTTDV